MIGPRRQVKKERKKASGGQRALPSGLLPALKSGAKLFDRFIILSYHSDMIESKTIRDAGASATDVRVERLREAANPFVCQHFTKNHGHIYAAQ